MSRIKRGKITRQRHNRVLKKAKGFFGQRKNVFCRAKETLMRALAYAFKGRKQLKRNMRCLFITRIGAAAKEQNLSYSVFIHKLAQANIKLNRKMLSQLAVFEPKVFERIVKAVQ
ncbi:50S ribosomal protein L20 [Candidatus Dependentiae bacterium]|nr:50S ribosomal protein L20 [Candidatus Dependentiae bacterium]